MRAVELQRHATCVLEVAGVPDFLEWKTKLSGKWAELLGAEEVALVDYLRRVAERNGDSLERTTVTHLLSRGYEFKALEIELAHCSWGRSVWYRRHPSYQDLPRKAFWKTRFLHNLERAMFKTEHAGDQSTNLYSSQMAGHILFDGGGLILLDKNIVYHKAVFILGQYARRRLNKPTTKKGEEA